MPSTARKFVSAFLPLFPLLFCHACGGGGGSDSGQAVSAGDPPSPVSPPSAPATVNRAPTINGDAAAFAYVGTTYEFQPAAADPDGDALHFTAQNLPPWASMDPNTGRLTGTPGANDVGSYESITITVADTALAVVGGPYTITVIAEATGVASLQWETPAAKVDGSPLDDLAGYRIVYGRNAEDLDQSVLIEDSSATSYEFSTLEPGVWYFAVIAVNASGLEGPPSTAAMKSI
jgi:hypothetical protein